MASSEKRDHTVQGMSCQHCVSSVREELAGLAGVEGVEVDLATGRVTVSGTGVTDDAVRAAVVEAGYEVA